MDTTARLILETAERIFREQVTPALRERAAEGAFPQTLWNTLQAQGLLAIADPDHELPASLIFELLRVAGRHAVPLPLAEALLAARWLGTPLRDLHTIGIGTAGSGIIAPWARQAVALLRVPQLFPVDGPTAQTPVELLTIDARVPVSEGLELEPLDNVRGRVERVLAVPDAGAELALSRAALMSGALEAVLDRSLRYVREREQFGRPLARFQAIQHQIAVLAAEVAAAQMATAGAIAEFGSAGWPEAAAAAKIRAGEAAGNVAEIAHQVHGAMGYTREHELHQFTLRLLRWRDEYGHEAEWQGWLGGRLLERGAAQCWAFIADGGMVSAAEQQTHPATGARGR